MVNIRHWSSHQRCSQRSGNILECSAKGTVWEKLCCLGRGSDFFILVTHWADCPQFPFSVSNVGFFSHDALVRRPENALVVILGVISRILDSPDSLKMVTIGTHRYPKWNGHANKGNTCQKFCREHIIACPDWQIGSTWENSWWVGLFLGSEGPNGLV